MSKKKLSANPISSRGTRLGLCIFLMAIVWLVFGQTLWHEFINYDDPGYVYENPVVRSGLTWPGFGWAFTHSHGGNWHPLTSLSHMLDSQLYGLKAGGHHFTSVLLHTVATVLLFLLLWQMTGALWRSAFVAAVFAIHPLHVESVAWVAERKDVLSGVFFMLTLLAYVRYTRVPSLGRYALMAVLLACGLMSKPMLVTVPLVLLLLDYWPLGRFTSSESDKSRMWQLIREKIPLFALSLVSCIITLIVQEKAIGSFARLPLVLRINNALVSYFTYLWQSIWPANLAVFYPHPVNQLPFWEITLVAMFLVTITIGSMAVSRKYPYLITGWFWYLVMLVPVIGVIQVGSQAHADRYTYLSQIGLCLALTWGLADLSRFWRRGREILSAGAIMVVVVLVASAWHQTSYWQESESLWAHTLAVTSNNDDADNGYANAVLKKGRIDEAILHYRRVLEIRPDHNEINRWEVYYNLGNALLRKGEIDDAIFQLKKFLQLRPDRAEAYYNLGNALLKKGQVVDALCYLQKAVELSPGNAVTENNVGYALLQYGRVEESLAHLRKALEINPDYAPAHANLANTLLQLGRADEAVSHLRRALAIDPRDAQTQKDMAWVLATSPDARIRDGAKAVELAESANQTESRNPIIRVTLAAAYAEAGRFPEAIRTAGEALQMANDSGNVALIKLIREQIMLYQSEQPFRDNR